KVSVAQLLMINERPFILLRMSGIFIPIFKKGEPMTTITYKENGVIFDGHAENPVVCHGISAVSQMVANFVEDRNWGEVIRKDGHLEIRDIKKECCSSELFQAMVIAIEDIANQYPNSIKIERG
ncbi:MAG TPA: ribosomal-processing cysteine protease Prp, partial [Candidatus Blautia avistercoris]|nr:ribosomal-processing cysteine protease Prp [Candidatus Blautia avistercoris]